MYEGGFRNYKSRLCKYSRFQLASNQTSNVFSSFFFWGGGHSVKSDRYMDVIIIAQPIYRALYAPILCQMKSPTYNFLVVTMFGQGPRLFGNGPGKT